MYFRLQIGQFCPFFNCAFEFAMFCAVKCDVPLSVTIDRWGSHKRGHQPIRLTWSMHVVAEMQSCARAILQPNWLKITGFMTEKE